MNEISIDPAICLSGWRMRIDNSQEPVDTGRLHVDYAQVRYLYRTVPALPAILRNYAGIFRAKMFGMAEPLVESVASSKLFHVSIRFLPYLRLTS